MSRYPAALALVLGHVFGLAGPLTAAGGADEQPVAADHAARMKAGTELFEKTIGPALTTHCLKCHGGEKVRAALDVSGRERLLEGGDSGAAIDLKNPAASRMLAVLRHEVEPHMPLKQPKLSETLISAFERWIEFGAPYGRALIEKAADSSGEMRVTDSDRNFWSFRPLRRVELPSVDGEWADTEIDRFVLAKLQAQGLEPSVPCDPRTFVRRAYLDLIGLPPTPAQLDRALSMSRAELIDSLLADPHHGERWARHWLDAVRFAESHGFEQDYNREYAFYFRDFVIQALNADMPFDRFVRWQLAGDEFEPDNPMAMMATGFLGAGVFPTQLTEKEFESARYDELDDMAATMGTAMLGLTIGCARCHDHKFDPIPVKDYYRLVATFATTIRSEIDLNLDPDGFRNATARWREGHSAVKESLADYEADPNFQAAFGRWLDAGAASAREKSPWSVVNPARATSSEATTFTHLPDGSVLAAGPAPPNETYTLTTTTSMRGIRWLRIEVLTHESLPGNGPGRASNGNFALSDFKVIASSADHPEATRSPLRLASATATHEQNQGHLSAASAIDSDPSGTGWAVDRGGIGVDQAVVFEISEPVEFPGATRLEWQLTFANNAHHSIGRPRLSISSEPAPPVAVGDGRSDAVREALAALDAGEFNPEHRRALFPLFAKTDETWWRLDEAVRASLELRPTPNLARVQVSSEGFPPTKHNADGRGFPHFYPETYFLNRGDPNQKRGVAAPGFLQVLVRNDRSDAAWRETPPDDWRTSYRRRSLANWITDPRDGAGHLLARVIVNRVWHHHFGRGIVATPNDFGLQGAPPSHPDLLEFLATQLIADGWRLKPLHRRIMLSAAYGQSSRGSAAKAAIDPDNQWLWRFRPRRLEAEIIRDSMLAVSGELDPTLFGKGTLDPNHRRRSIYFMVKRSQLVPMMQIFDQPEPLVSQGGRPSTTIAPQALAFMNGPQVVDWAAAMAKRVGQSNPETAIREIYLRGLGREPSVEELVDSLTFVSEQMASYRSADARELALADFCQVVFGLNEFIYLQ